MDLATQYIHRILWILSKIFSCFNSDGKRHFDMEVIIILIPPPVASSYAEERFPAFPELAISDREGKESASGL